MYKTIVSLVAISLLLQACAGSSVQQKELADAVTSTPSGALVYANGKELGLTPLSQDLYDAFPAGWKNSSYQAQGELIVKMSGCEDFKLNITDYILSQPIHAELNCDQPELLESSESALSAVEKRLNELKQLYDKGVISRQEYDGTRQRILSEL